MDKVLAVDLPDSPVDPGSITDWQNWSPQVWGVIAGLLILMTAVFFWKSMSGKAQMLIVVALIATVVFLVANN